MQRLPSSIRLTTFARLAAGALFVTGCAAAGGQTTAPATMAQMVATQPASPDTNGPGLGQATFASDDDASKALVAAFAADDRDKVHQILGPQWKDLLTGDKVQDSNAFKEFATAASDQNHLQMKDDHTAILYVGKNDWPSPIPIVRNADGRWYFDTAAGKAEILARDIGADELSAIDVCRAYVRAQRIYFRQPHDDSDIVQYAQRIHSHDGKQDGLYYPVAAGEKQSPFGPLMADAESQGYTDTKGLSPYHGYRFHILTKQGPDAPGGAYDYLINGHLVGGFALVAFPDKYGASGVMTFIVNQRGKVYQKDLGANTTDLAWHLTAYDPDSTWTLVQP